MFALVVVELDLVPNSFSSCFNWIVDMGVCSKDITFPAKNAPGGSKNAATLRPMSESGPGIFAGATAKSNAAIVRKRNACRKTDFKPIKSRWGRRAVIVVARRAGAGPPWRQING